MEPAQDTPSSDDIHRHHDADQQDLDREEGAEKVPKKPRATDHKRDTPKDRPDCRQRTYARLYPTVCVLSKQPIDLLNDVFHYLPRSLEDAHPGLFHSLRKAIGVWEWLNGRWERHLNLDLFPNLDIITKTFHAALDGTCGLGSGFIAFLPIKPSLEECVKRIKANMMQGLSLDQLFSEFCFEYTLFLFDGQQLLIPLHDGESRVYPCPPPAEKARLQAAAAATNSGDLSGRIIRVPNGDFRFLSHINPALVVADLRIKLESRHGGAGSLLWDDAPQVERDLFAVLSPDTDYLLDQSLWDPPKMPPLQYRFKRSVVRRSQRTNLAKTESPKRPPSKIPLRAAKTAASAFDKAAKKTPSLSLYQLQGKSKLTATVTVAGTSASANTSLSPPATRMRTRSQTRLAQPRQVALSRLERGEAGNHLL